MRVPICFNCGESHRIRATDNYCHSCGARLEDAQSLRNSIQDFMPDEIRTEGKRIFENIFNLCKERGTTLEKLEFEIGLKRKTISGWTRYSPTVHDLKTVADYFDVSIDFLVGRQDSRELMCGLLSGTGDKPEKETTG